MFLQLRCKNHPPPIHVNIFLTDILFRSNLTSPMGQQAYPPGFPNMMSGAGGGMMNGNFPYGQVPFYSPQQVQQQAGGRPRGRVCFFINSVAGIR